MRSLLIDDNDTNRFVAQQLLLAGQCEVVMATDGEAGVRHAMEQEFDLILLDINLPKLDGWSAAKEIRRSLLAKSRRTPIYILTGSTHQDQTAEAIESEVQGVIQKPLRAKHLEIIFAEIVASSSMARSDGTARANATSIETASINFEIINELQEVLGHTRLVAVQHKFVGEIVIGLQQLSTFFKHGRVHEAARIAHKLIGSALVFGAAKIATNLSIIEQTAPTIVQEQMDKILGDIALLIAFYEKQIQTK